MTNSSIKSAKRIFEVLEYFEDVKRPISLKEVATKCDYPTSSAAALLKSMALQAHIRSALKANEATHAVSITIESVDGHVTLRGIVLKAPERSAAEQVAAGVPGVASVDNQLRVMNSSRLFTSSKT